MRIPAFHPVGDIAPPQTRPADYFRKTHYTDGGWFQDDPNDPHHHHPIRKRVKKPYYHFIWPKDGKNRGKWGRAKDILKGTGPDIHVTIGAGKMDYMHHRQRRATWARHRDLDDRHNDPRSTLKVPWAPTRKRAGLAYDFLERKYRPRDWNMMTDARWGSDPRKKFPFPEEFRDLSGMWWKNDPNALRDFFLRNNFWQNALHFDELWNNPYGDYPYSPNPYEPYPG